MGASKTIGFTADELAMAQLAKALAHPARVAILRLLMEKQACICGDLVDELPLSQSTVSQHLKELKQAGLIKGDIEGPRVCYCIDADALQTARQLLHSFLNGYRPLATACC